MASKEDQMSPEASPDQAGGKIGIRRVNNMPMYIVGGAMSLFLLVMVLVASNRAAKQNQPPNKSEVGKVENTSMFAKAVAGDRQDGIVQPKAAKVATAPGDPATLSSPESASGIVTIVRPGNPDDPPAPPHGGQGSSGPSGGSDGAGGDGANQIRIMKMQQFDEAVKAKTSLNVTAPRSANPSRAVNGVNGGDGVRQQQPGDLLEIYKSQLALVQNSGLEGSGGPPSQSGQATAAGNSAGIAQFGDSGQGDRWKLDSKVQPPRSRYELRAGFVVPATLISGINSELPGQIMAQVSQNVYDTATGRYLLIPQGCRLVGTYSSNVAYGQSWLLVAWQRIVFPDGKVMDIGSMPGANSAGYAGFKDRVNHHYFRIFGSALLMSGVVAGIATSQPTQNANSAPTASTALSQALGIELGQVAAQMIAKNLSIAPTLDIRPGYRFNVMATKDLTFSKPYQPFDY